MSTEIGSRRFEQTNKYSSAESAGAAEAVAEIHALIVRTVRAELAAEAASVASDVADGQFGTSGRSSVDVLGKLLDRLPDALTVAEVGLILDRFDVALRGHSGSPSIPASGPESRDASEVIVGEAPGAPAPQADAAPGAPSEDDPR